MEAVTAGFAVFGIIIVSGLMLLGYIALNMKYSKRTKNLRDNYITAYLYQLGENADKIYKSMNHETVDRILKEPISMTREKLVTKEVTAHLFAQKQDRALVSTYTTWLMFHHFGGYSNSTAI